MILITAATGQVGRAALKALVGAGTEVRALVRDPSPFEAPEGVQVVHGDFEDDTSIAKALKGVSVMLLAGRDSPDSVSQHRRVLAQVRQAGVRHVVKLSAIGASPESPIALMREHHEIDEEIRKGPASWTLLKPHTLTCRTCCAPPMRFGAKEVCRPDGEQQISARRYA